VKWTDTIVIGAGQAGLAMSRCLSEQGIDHVVLERGRVAERWRSERWDSLRLLTPNWLSRLPGFAYDGPAPDGFMTMPEVIEYFERYARTFDPPLECDTTVLDVSHNASGYHVVTTRSTWQARAVVIATGYCDLPYVPAAAAHLPAGIQQVTPGSYRNPGQLPPGAVLVVGASATGVQLADEIQDSGRQVTIAVGSHTRLPRRRRGRDIMWWLDRAGILNETTSAVRDLEASRNQPSLQLVGRPDNATLDLPALMRKGVRVAGRLLSADADRFTFADDLVATTSAADLKLAALLDRLDQCRTSPDGFAASDANEPFEPTWPAFIDAAPMLTLGTGDVRTVVWATGFRRTYPWLRVPVLDSRGEIRHQGGITPAAGLYVMGLNFMRRRKSAFIDGVGGDAEALATDITQYLGHGRAIA
jgi:putative flavoprotein involved in K+ transport